MDEAKIKAKKCALRRLAEDKDKKVYGVLAVTVKECMELELPVKKDENPYPEKKGHLIIDLSIFTGNDDLRTLRQQELTVIANNRGWLYLN